MLDPSSSEGRRTIQVPLGRVVITAHAKAVLDAPSVLQAITRHQSGDWGEVDTADWRENEFSLTRNLRLLSVYRDTSGRKFYVITEADRSSTCVLLPEDY
jgi:hypothetical protein